MTHLQVLTSLPESSNHSKAQIQGTASFPYIVAFIPEFETKPNVCFLLQENNLQLKCWAAKNEQIEP
jgi:hypothetical protein